MAVVVWIVVGLVIGLLAAAVLGRSARGFLIEIALGVVGGFVGGYAFARFGVAGAAGVNLYTILVSMVGALLVLFVYHAITATEHM